MSDTFSARLRAASWQDHQAAESQRYVSALVAGELPRQRYADLVAQHHFIYQVLEEAADAMREDPLAGDFVDDRLTRLPALEADLAYLLGPDWAGRVGPNLATRRYVARMQEVCFTFAPAFIAHHYTRYLGDLSGGLFIGRQVAQTYGLTEEGGVAFYHFAGIDDPRGYKNAYRARLDALPLDVTAEAALVGEVAVAYRHNSAVLAELGQEQEPKSVASESMESAA
ncbi:MULTISPECIES: biliverdin-producing heme oxygenase [unclassified Solwaraspora]|uniref:biliverdin-producing heme oxygenase n=1 Tax=unclassified Solwaraspora TaxID=2627926 RepID=UPI00248CB083|nr:MULTISPECIES: biliverdin-producing heme oxygenase [unclassified Solwaraspora]WBB95972.1 biliverdin-producing heme oxygenase [Solwaraspora sp. WMMA2059]WBC20124.1 biliverdin-producing heme oxygenase [Solwaraspora sp. WMMA2080]WJK32289.1 biliverdin-producing heme oxygenase [Solwaraspora sp. WMMA2065]